MASSPLLSSTPTTYKPLKSLLTRGSDLKSFANSSPSSTQSYGTEDYSSPAQQLPFSKLRDSDGVSPDTVVVAFPSSAHNNNPTTESEVDHANRTLNFNDTPTKYTVTNSTAAPKEFEAVVPFGEEQSSHAGATKPNKEEQPPFKSAIFCVIPLFMGYACLFSLQGKIKDAYGITTQGERFEQFGNAVSFLYMGNLVFRFAHNILFFCLSPRIRVLIAMLSMVAALNLLLWGVFICQLTHTLAWVYGAYALGGVAVGTFEANLLSSITPLGHQTKLWATLGKRCVCCFFCSCLTSERLLLLLLLLLFAQRV